MKRLAVLLGLAAALEGCTAERTLSVTTEPPGARIFLVNTSTTGSTDGDSYVTGRKDELQPLGVSPVTDFAYGGEITAFTKVVGGTLASPLLAMGTVYDAAHGQATEARPYPQITVIAEEDGYYPSRKKMSIANDTPRHVDVHFDLKKIQLHTLDIIAPPGTRIALERPVMQYDAKAGKPVPTGMAYQHEGIGQVHLDKYVDVFPGVPEDGLLGVELRQGSKYRKTYIRLGQSTYHLGFPED